MLRKGTVVLNVKDARRASQFWSQALGYTYQDGASFVVLGDPEGNLFCVVNTARE
jgi:predicted enzyme related to lactoylglutathione lyase